MTEKISLLDLRRRTTSYQLNGGEHALTLRGLSAREICDHLERFPLLRVISIGGTMSPVDAITGTSGTAAAWVASACGNHMDQDAEKAAEDNLTIEEQSEIIEASLDLTFSKGFGPFSARLAVLLGYVTVGAGREPGMRSPPPSRPAEPPSTTELGNSPPDSSKQPSSSASEEDLQTPQT